MLRLPLVVLLIVLSGVAAEEPARPRQPAEGTGRGDGPRGRAEGTAPLTEEGRPQQEQQEMEEVNKAATKN